MATGLFNPALVSPKEFLNPDQKARAAALTVAQQVKSDARIKDLIALAVFIVGGGEEYQTHLSVGKVIKNAAIEDYTDVPDDPRTLFEGGGEDG